MGIIIAIDNMTGGPFGAFGYLNYLKNNIHPGAIRHSDDFVMEKSSGETSKVFYKV